MKSVFARSLPACLLVAAALGNVAAMAQSADWPYWRGPKFDGSAEATGLPDNWDPDGGEGSHLIWKRDDIGGPCTPIVMNGRLYTIQRSEEGTSREGERVVCLDAKTGETIWENRYNVWLSDVPAERVGWSSVVGDSETGNVYVLGACDLFKCINGETGETVWENPLHEQYGMLSTYGGRTNFPVIHEDLVIISGIIINWGDYAKPNHRLMAFDKRSGELIWFSGTKDLPEDTTYSAPSLVTIDGQRQLIFGAGDGAIWGFQPRTGKPLWHYRLSLRGIYATPLVDGDMVFATHSEENIDGRSMGAVVGLKISGTGEATKVEEVWKVKDLIVGYSEPVVIGDRLYVVDDRCKMWIFDKMTGEPIVEQKGFVSSRQRSALLSADGKIYVLSENGPWAIVAPTEEGFEVLNKGRIRDTQFAGSPIVADGRLYFPSTTALYCVGSESSSQTPIEMADSMGEEAAPSENLEATQILLVPAEAIVKPGESIEFSVRAFNRLGQPVETPTEVTLSVEGPGTVEGMTFTAARDVAHTAAVIQAQCGNAVGIARVRIIPPLPWKFTFDGLGDPPVSWVGARYRHVIRDIDGSPALVKIVTIPKGARSRASMGPSDLSNYTITADVRGARMSDKLPDIGVTAHGYTMDLMGESQQLQIRTWDAQLRMAETIDFPWKEDTWYRIKLRAEIESEPPAAVAVLKGKVWPRDEPEPEDWTITARDESPNMNASPGLYGNAKDAEIYIDNVEVFAND
ncbi:outer membrane protein assembly factor BamB family protein [Novipirellula artificiosorum]|uniref:Outer membrane biogenesis protein BamB n=1 Tax=Novipirellula artificiosorum TaxID=2528016 RepID=A0A5C6E4I6_9BACT|nr:PQQ-binding-like beta-propeller repeat protein [Novipirellula artificiosorum]TWU42907.1 outer membrane biogenesis protein BamB [Novipirellula artificiosorum]